MLTKEQNEKLTRVGADTPGGRFLRRFWTPFMPSADLERDGEPKRVKLMGEELVVFRNRDGDVGMLDRYCPHRGVDLFFGRNEDCGLRCIYHGWKMELDGSVSDMPNISKVGDELLGRTRTTAYPVHDDGSLLWAYMGPAEHQPPPPAVGYSGADPEMLRVVRYDHLGNWFQHVEGQVDGSHVAFVHADLDMTNSENYGGPSPAFIDRQPGVFLEDTDWGTSVGWLRKADEGRTNLRLTQWVAPWMACVENPPPYLMSTYQFVVPMDDESTIFLIVLQRKEGYPVETSIMRDEVVPGTYEIVDRWETNYGLDRELQRTQYFSGIRSVRLQDLAAQERVRGGLIADRTNERLVSSDKAVIHVRRRVLSLIERLERGEDIAEPGAIGATRMWPFEVNLEADVDPVSYALENGMAPAGA